jgi:hypothetical protein
VANCQIATSSWVVKDDTAVALEGGYIILNGAGFVAGANVIIGSVAAAAVTVVNSTTIRAQVNAAAAGTYVIYVVNPDGSVGILVNGLTYSATPTWITGSTLPEQMTNVAVNIQLNATGANVYALSAGNSLPSGLNLSSGGLLSGTVTVAQQTVYAFSVDAIDTELQDSPRTFSLTISVAPVDPYFEYVSLLLHGDGANTAQNNTFLDSSTNNFGINRFGDTTQGTFSPFSRADGSWSNYFDNSGDYLSAPSNAAFAVGTGNFTWEAWVYPVSFAATYEPIYMTNVTGGLWIGKNGSNFAVRASGVADQLQYSVMPSTNTWTHIVAVRSGTTLSLYYNGVRVATTTNSYDFQQGAAIIASDLPAGGSDYFDGYISNLRLVKGTAVYDPTQATLNVPTAPLTAVANTSLLTCQSNRFRDASTNNFAITVNGNTAVQVFNPFNPTTVYSTTANGGSGYFDGSGDYLTAASNAAFNLSSGAYTIECFVYFTTAPSTTILFGLAGGAVLGYATLLYSGGSLYWQQRGTSSNETAFSWAPTTGQWYHIAIGWSGTNLAIWINGVRLATNTVTPTGNGQNGVNVGAGSDGYAVGGYISGFRIVKGTDVYGTGNTSITVPTTPPTAIANTSLLLNFTNGGIFDNAAMNDLVTLGNAQVRTNIKKYGTGSMYFDGTDDLLTMQASPNFAFGTGDFTIEFWMYSNDVSSSTQRGPMQSSTTPGGISTSYSTGIMFAQGMNGNNQNLSGGLAFNILGTSVGSVSAVVTTSTWYHIAATRQSGTVRLFVNGVLMDTKTQAGSVDGQNFCIGGYYSTRYYYDGYIDDLRITKGYARYTANFTPPDAAFPDF